MLGSYAQLHSASDPMGSKMAERSCEWSSATVVSNRAESIDGTIRSLVLSVADPIAKGALRRSSSGRPASHDWLTRQPRQLAAPLPSRDPRARPSQAASRTPYPLPAQVLGPRAVCRHSHERQRAGPRPAADPHDHEPAVPGAVSERRPRRRYHRGAPRPQWVRAGQGSGSHGARRSSRGLSSDWERLPKPVRHRHVRNGPTRSADRAD